MNHRLPVCTAALLVAATLGACATSPELDRTFGQSVRGALASQVINPEAAANTNPVHGVDATAAIAAQERYQKSFASPPALQPAMVIGR